MFSYSVIKNSIITNYTNNNNPIECNTSIKDLGVTFDRELRFDLHINLITNSAVKLLGFINRSLNDFKNLNCFKVVYFSFVRSKL